MKNLMRIIGMIFLVNIVVSCAPTKQVVAPVAKKAPMTDAGRIAAFVDNQSTDAAESTVKNIINFQSRLFDSPQVFITNHPQVGIMVISKYKYYDDESKTEEELYKSIESLYGNILSAIEPNTETQKDPLEKLFIKYDQDTLARFHDAFTGKFKDEYDRLFPNPKKTKKRIGDICNSFYNQYQKNVERLLVSYFKTYDCPGVEVTLTEVFQNQDIDPDEEVMQGLSTALCRLFSSAYKSILVTSIEKVSNEVSANYLISLTINIYNEVAGNVTTVVSERLVKRLGGVPINQLTAQEIDIIQRTPRFSGITDDDLKSMALKILDLNDILNLKEESNKSLTIVDGNLLSYYDTTNNYYDADSRLFEQSLTENILTNYPSIDLLERDGIVLNSLNHEILKQFLISVRLNNPFNDANRIPYAIDNFLQNKIKWSSSTLILVYWPLEFKVLKESLGYRDKIPYRKRRALVRVYLELIDPKTGKIIYSGIKTPPRLITDETPVIWDYLAEGRGYAPLRDLNKKQNRTSIAYEETDKLGIPFDGITDEDLLQDAFSQLDLNKIPDTLFDKSTSYLALRDSNSLPGNKLPEESRRASFLLTRNLVSSDYQMLTRDPNVLSRIYHEVKPIFTMYLGKIYKEIKKSDMDETEEIKWKKESINLDQPYIFNTPFQDLISLTAADYIIAFDVLEMGIRELPEPQKAKNEYYSRTAKVSLFLKVINTKTAQIIWAGKIEATTKPKNTPVIYKHLARGERWFFVPDPRSKIEVIEPVIAPTPLIPKPTKTPAPSIINQAGEIADIF